MSISDELYRILVQWRDDATSDSPSVSVRRFGLCSYVAEHSEGYGAKIGLQGLFRAEGRDPNYPFCPWYEYNREAEDGVMHLNSYRRSWVERRIHEYEMNHGGQ